ncbi:hypothetical protein CGLO_13997 [Colletotrichum gloeosporioides Cg-14]|uniref:Uncharacterized protein n=1 Tax=Colletotrichum gloeosporioides (strain Cg-14) TaxID=1237896 RepID=T0K4P2_COLGC|nr:hypothetical protein CGLO_13997 [Colletotrichum gloeosporioides Cg-14]
MCPLYLGNYKQYFEFI